MTSEDSFVLVNEDVRRLSMDSSTERDPLYVVERHDTECGEYGEYGEYECSRAECSPALADPVEPNIEPAKGVQTRSRKAKPGKACSACSAAPDRETSPMSSAPSPGKEARSSSSGSTPGVVTYPQPSGGAPGQVTTPSADARSSGSNSPSSPSAGLPGARSASSTRPEPSPRSSRPVPSANIDEAKRCVEDANLLLLGSVNWPEEKRMEMIHKATRLLRKAHQMSEATIPSVPQWLSMRSRMPAGTIQDALRSYAREDARRRSTPSASSRDHATPPAAAEETVIDGRCACVRIAWRRLHYVAFELTGLGQFFAPEWKSTILVVYLIVFLLATLRWANGAPLINILIGEEPTATTPPPPHAYTTPLPHAEPPEHGEQEGFTPRNPRHRRGFSDMDEWYGEDEVHWHYSSPLLSWPVFFLVPLMINHMQNAIEFLARLFARPNAP